MPVHLFYIQQQTPHPVFLGDNLTNKHRRPEVTPWGFSLRPHHLVSWGKGRAMVPGKPALLFFTSEVCSPQAPSHFSTATERAFPLAPSPSVHPRAAVLLSHLSTVDGLFISYSPFTPSTHHQPIRSLWLQWNICSVHTYAHDPSRWCLRQNSKHLWRHIPFLFMSSKSHHFYLSILWEISWKIVTFSELEKILCFI